MMFGLVNVSFSLPKWQAEKITFFAPCIYAKYRVQIMLLFVDTTTRKRFVIFTFSNFKLS